MPNEGQRWTPTPPAASQHVQAGSIAEFGHGNCLSFPAGTSWADSHDQRPTTVAHTGTVASPGQGSSMAQFSMPRDGSAVGALSTVPEWDALFFGDDGGVGMLPGFQAQSNDSEWPPHIPHATNEFYHHALPTFSSYPTSTAFPALPTATTVSSLTYAPLSSGMPGISSTTNVQAQPQLVGPQGSREQAMTNAATVGSGTRGMNAQWDPMTVNGVRILYVVHGYLVEVDLSDFPFPNAPQAGPGGIRPRMFVATSGPVDPHTVLRPSSVAAIISSRQGSSLSQNAPSASTVRPTRPLPSRRRQRGSQATGHHQNAGTSSASPQGNVSS